MHSTEGNRLRELRVLKGLSQQALADSLTGEIDRSTISRWENGESDIPLERVRELAEFFHVSTTWLLGWEADPWETDGERLTETSVERHAATRRSA